MISAIPFAARPASDSLCSMSVPPASARRGAGARWAMEPTVAAVPRVRASVRSVLGGWRIEPDRAEDMLLAVTELVSNAIRHAGATGRLRVAITLAAGWLQLDVADGDSALPPSASEVELSSADAESGRGLVIVDCLAREAGGRLMAFRAGGGKVVRVRIPASVRCSSSPAEAPRGNAM